MLGVQFTDAKTWRIEEHGPLHQQFQLLKRNMELIDEGVAVRPDQERVKIKWQVLSAAKSAALPEKGLSQSSVIKMMSQSLQPM